MRLTPAGLLAFGRLIPVSLGRGGIARAKSEGDGATPAALLHVTATLFRPDRLAAPAPWARPILPGDLWCDDPAHPAYNRPARAPMAASHEVMRRSDSLYDVVLVTDWNAAGHPGAGSAIFLHQWRRPGWPTAGCIAMARSDLLWLAARAAPGTPLAVPNLASARARRMAPSQV
ncbi:hypothetical protein DRW48_04500 [Paracoccus suum]|uniref:L,D-TPase catalytic domain-containing protein n=1 Tax=Paracoccus suum TaxID=2259340 RepID=A0A344PI42_9RHOB|nr:L,D-transpeptidase family protein [Paracoccus suum]AXC49047.1 hypothetical protein DRW48_04500 [Paracoccus suum]